MSERGTTTIDALIERYSGLLFDAFGVLNHGSGALPGAVDLIARLNAIGKPYLVLSNDASRSQAQAAARLRGYGLAVDDASMVTSGMLVGERLTTVRRRCLVIGSETAKQNVAAFGAELVASSVDAEFDFLIACGTRDCAFIDELDDATSALFRALDAGRRPQLLLPNPDLIYPRDRGAFGFTAGAVATLIEAALARRYPEESLRFERLGKPYAPLFEVALDRLGTRDVVMIGDQLETDIAGAVRVGIDSALVETGIAVRGVASSLPTATGGEGDRRVAPTWLLAPFASGAVER